MVSKLLGFPARHQHLGFTIQGFLSSGTMRAGLTKMVSKLSKEGSFRKGLEVFQALPELGIAPDTAITNSAISACDKGARLAPCCFMGERSSRRQRLVITHSHYAERSGAWRAAPVCNALCGRQASWDVHAPFAVMLT